MTFTYEIHQYRSGSRYVVIEACADDAGSQVVFGPDTIEACRDYTLTVNQAEVDPSDSRAPSVGNSVESV